MIGIFKLCENPFAKLTPVNNAPARPGPFVTPIPPISFKEMLASFIDSITK